MLIRLRPGAGALQLPAIPRLNLPLNIQRSLSSPSSINPYNLSVFPLSTRTQRPTFVVSARKSRRDDALVEPEEAEAQVVVEEDGRNGEEEVEEDEFSYLNESIGREEEKDYDRDPEFAEILGSCFDDPQKAQARVEERIRRKRSKILHTKTGSATPMKVIFNKFDFLNSYIWFEFYNAPLAKDVSLICDTIRSWHIVGRLGGCNSMNMQLSQAPLDTKRPSYDAIQGANVTPTTFYNIGDLEIQDNLAQIWVDIGTSEPLLLDVLINALNTISSE